MSGSLMAHEVVERRRERAVREADDAVAVAVEHGCAFLGDVSRELAHEAALARARLAGDERRAAPLPGRAGHQGEKGRTLLGASRKGEGGREPERARQWGTGAHRMINLDHCASSTDSEKSVRLGHDSALSPPYPPADRRERPGGGRMSTTVSAVESARAELSTFGERLIGPDDARYEEARALFNAMIDKRPALIARCETADDVTAAIRFARDHDLRIAVRGGAHNGAGLASVDDGLVIDLSPMKSIAVDPAAQTVRVGAGSVWGEVDAATQPHNLAVPTGIISSTGVAGLTLGGGHGYLARRHGLTVDNLLAAKMVLADGSQVTVSASEHPDLFWAIRGGGGNFGVVTEFTFRAHPLETIVGGPTFWAIEQADELLTAYREWLPSAPRNVMGFFNFHTIPPVAEAFPEELHLRKVCGIVWCIDASDEDAEAAMAPILSVAEPLLHGVQRMPIAALNGAFDGLYGPGDQWYWRGDFVREIPDQAVVLNREWNERMPGFKAGTHLYPIDGAVQDVKAEDTAWAYRDATWSQVFIGCDPEPAKADALREWTVGYSEALRPYAAGAGYVNFMMDDEGAGRVKATYGANYPRLQRVKAEYDPENVFRVNQNILPA